jgi:hypothetical protein
MALPLQCQRTKTGSCIGDKCPMYIVEWRSKEEYCIIGYYPVSERKSRGKPIIDDYARGILGETKTKNMMNMEDIPDDYEKEFWDQ